jgi:hypothetical protein
MSKTSRAYKQGLFIPRNPQKYSGNVSNIIYRSSWELRTFEWADMNPSVISWSSEETIIPYVSKVDGRYHRYFIDLKLKIRGTDGEVKDYIVEIKPFQQTQPPKFPGRQTPRYLKEVETFITNQSKWEAAKVYAEERKMKFVILTEKELFGIKNGSTKHTS